jgi:hypothetical protein
VVDGGPGLLQGEHLERHHQAGADDGRAGAVHPEAGQAPQSQYEIGPQENQSGREHEAILLLAFAISSG